MPVIKYNPPLVVDRANASSTEGGCRKSPKCVIDKGGGVSDKPWFFYAKCEYMTSMM